MPPGLLRSVMVRGGAGIRFHGGLVQHSGACCVCLCRLRGASGLRQPAWSGNGWRLSKIMTWCTGLALASALAGCGQPTARTAGPWGRAIEIPGLAALDKGGHAKGVLGVMRIAGQLHGRRDLQRRPPLQRQLWEGVRDH